MNFEYMYTTQAMDSVDIEDPGNTALNALTDDGIEYYLIIETLLGQTTIQRFGPLMVDMCTLGNMFYYSNNKYQYNEKVVIQAIKKFLTTDKITQVFEIDIDEAKNRLKELTDNPL